MLAHFVFCLFSIFCQVNARSLSNPILKNGSSPSVLKVNDTYFMVADGFYRYQIPIFESKDLQNWELSAFVFSEENYPSWANFDIDTFANPEIHYINGAFNVYYETFNFQLANAIGVATAPTPKGPYMDIGKPLQKNVTANLYTPNIAREGKTLEQHIWDIFLSCCTWSCTLDIEFSTS